MVAITVAGPLGRARSSLKLFVHCKCWDLLHKNFNFSRARPNSFSLLFFLLSLVWLLVSFTVFVVLERGLPECIALS